MMVNQSIRWKECSSFFTLNWHKHYTVTWLNNTYWIMDVVKLVKVDNDLIQTQMVTLSNPEFTLM